MFERVCFLLTADQSAFGYIFAFASICELLHVKMWGRKVRNKSKDLKWNGRLASWLLLSHGLDLSKHNAFVRGSAMLYYHLIVFYPEQRAGCLGFSLFRFWNSSFETTFCFVPSLRHLPSLCALSPVTTIHWPLTVLTDRLPSATQILKVGQTDSFSFFDNTGVSRLNSDN